MIPSEVDPNHGDTDPRAAAVSLGAVYKICLADPYFSKRFDMSTWKYLGKGSSGHVVSLYCPLRKAVVAVKIFRQGTDEDPRVRLPSEIANSSTSERHVLIHAPLENHAGDLVWLEMELLGRSLQQELEKRTAEQRPFTLEESLAIAIDAAEALKDAHHKGILHRDVKPGNFLFTAAGPHLVKLGDFGISKTPDINLTGTGAFRGTPEYAAPEVADGMGCKASDIYSLGHTLYRLVTGHAAIPIPANATVHQALQAHKTGRRRAAREVMPNIPASLNNIFSRMIVPRPEARPEIDEVLQILRDTRAELEAAKRPAPPPAAQTPRWKSAAVAAVAVVVLALALVGRKPSTPTESTSTTTKVGPPPPKSTPASILAIATPIPAAPAAIYRVRRADDGGIWFENPTAETIPSLELTLITVAGGRHTSRLAAVEPGEMWLTAEDFTPPTSSASEIARVEALVPGRSNFVLPLSQ